MGVQLVRQVEGQVGQVRGQVGGQVGGQVKAQVKGRGQDGGGAIAAGMHLAGIGVAMESRRADGENWACPYLSYLLRNVTPHNIPEPFREPFREASGSFRNSGKLSTCYKLPARLPETFRDLPELQRKDKITKQASGKLPETFRDLPELQRK